jgi:mannose-6-phosphate isomerase-like protein (cupin superfamily)
MIVMVERPWGYFAILEDTPTHKVKRITVYEGQRLSLQSHEKRDEMWYIIEGEGSVTLNTTELKVEKGSVVKVPRGVKHRIKNIGKGHLQFVEVQTGLYFGEDDIVRYSDDYGRL